MRKASFGSIFVLTLVSGLFTAVGVDPNEMIAQALYSVIDAFSSLGNGSNPAVYKALIYFLLVVVPLILDVIVIWQFGAIGIIAAVLGFSAGLTLVFIPLLGAILIIIGMIATAFLGDSSAESGSFIQ